MPLIYAFNRSCRSPQTSKVSNINGIDLNIKYIEEKSEFDDDKDQINHKKAAEAEPEKIIVSRDSKDLLTGENKLMDSQELKLQKLTFDGYD